MSSPSTAAGRALLEAFITKPDEPDFAIRISEESVIRHAIPRIEQEARAALLDELEAKVMGISLPPGPDFAWVDGHMPFINAVLALFREARG